MDLGLWSVVICWLKPGNNLLCYHANLLLSSLIIKVILPNNCYRVHTVKLTLLFSIFSFQRNARLYREHIKSEDAIAVASEICFFLWCLSWNLNYTKFNKKILKITFDQKKKKNHTQIYKVLPFLFTEFSYFEIVVW